MELDDASIDCIVFDPPYHNNVNYAELSDFFYVWLKRTAGYVFPEYFTDHLTDKTNEAIASPARFRGEGSRSESRRQEIESLGVKARHTGLPRQDARDIRRVPPGHKARRGRRHNDRDVHPQRTVRVGRAHYRADRGGVQHHARLAHQDRSRVQPDI